MPSSEAVPYIIAKDLLAQEPMSLATAPAGYADSGIHEVYHYPRWRRCLLCRERPPNVCWSYYPLPQPFRSTYWPCQRYQGKMLCAKGVKKAWRCDPHQEGSRAKQIPHQRYGRQRHSCSTRYRWDHGVSLYRWWWWWWALNVLRSRYHTCTVVSWLTLSRWQQQYASFAKLLRILCQLHVWNCTCLCSRSSVFVIIATQS